MEELLHKIAEYAAVGLDFVAVLIVAIGAIEALFGMFRVVLNRHSTDSEKRVVWIRFARWLVVALTFQLGADIVNTTVAPTWDELGRLGAIAVIRTFLTYFLDRDLDQMRKEQQARLEGGRHADVS
jgi:uncharacterized membrane protein